MDYVISRSAEIRVAENATLEVSDLWVASTNPNLMVSRAFLEVFGTVSPCLFPPPFFLSSCEFTLFGVRFHFPTHLWIIS